MISASTADVVLQVKAAATLGGDPCLTDCKPEQAGHYCAQQNGIAESYDCNTPSDSPDEDIGKYVGQAMKKSACF